MKDFQTLVTDPDAPAPPVFTANPGWYAVFIDPAADGKELPATCLTVVAWVVVACNDCGSPGALPMVRVKGNAGAEVVTHHPDYPGLFLGLLEPGEYLERRYGDAIREFVTVDPL